MGSSTTAGYANPSASAFALANTSPTVMTNGHSTQAGSAFTFIQGQASNGVVDSSSSPAAAGKGIGNLDSGSLYAAAEPTQTRSVTTSNYSALNPGLSTEIATKHFDIAVTNGGGAASKPDDFEALQRATM